MNSAPFSTRGLFVTGSDTGVGKTYVACEMIRRLIERGRSVGAYKPVVSGAETAADGSLVWDDVEKLCAALRRPDWHERVAPQRFRAALSPPAAAAAEGRRVDSRRLREGAGWWKGRVEFLVVEGTGGWLSPASDDDLVADLARDLGCPVLIVSRLGLGAINQALLVAESVRARGLRAAGIVLNAQAADVDDPAARSNPAELARWTDVPIVAVTRRSAAPRADFERLLAEEIEALFGPIL